MQFISVGVNYKSAPLAIREKLACDALSSRDMLSQLFEHLHIQESVLLSTCNRTEVYVIGSDPQAARASIVQLMCQHSGLSERDLEAYTYTYYNKFAATHLFDVSAGLDSLVLGENEILRQVKQALQTARDLETVGPILNQLFRFAITAGKRIRHETEINQGCTSLGALAARVLNSHLPQNAEVLIVGAGQMADVVVKNLQDSHFHLHLANRTPERATALLSQYRGNSEVHDLSDVPNLLGRVQAIVSCTAADHYLIKANELQIQTHPAHVLVDLSVPRNIDPKCQALPGVSYFDVDHLEAVIQNSLEQRQRATQQAQSIIAEESARFLEWFHSRELAPTIRSFQAKLENIRQHELKRGTQKYNEQLSQEAQAVLDRVTHAITQKVLHYPVVKLKTLSDPKKRALYHEVLNDLFGLDSQDSIDTYVPLERSHTQVKT